MQKVVLAGGTGFIGSYLAKRFKDHNYRVEIVSRESGYVSWEQLSLVAALEGAELVVNLAGKSINCRHNETNRHDILESRLRATESIGWAIRACAQPPRLWINASAAGVYKPFLSQPMAEDEPELGTDFLAHVVKEWEKTFFTFELNQTRQVALRTAVVLGWGGGALEPLVRLTKLRLGGAQGSGKQLFSWIHVEDYFRIIMFLLENPSLEGVINCCAPSPVRNGMLMRLLRRRLHVAFGLPAPAFAVRLGSKLVGVESDLILNSSYVVPKRLLEAGFQFYYPEVDLALIDLVRLR